MLKWKFGDTTITQLIELKDDSGSVPVLPDATPENLATIPWLKPHFVTPDGKLILNIQMMIIETPDRKMVVDTCIGNDKTLALDAWANMQRPFIDNLKKLRLRPGFHRHRDLHPFACRPRRLEHQEGQWQMGADLQERALRDGRFGVQPLAEPQG